MQQQIPTFGEIEALQLLVVSDNINSDGKINPGENIRVTARLGNASLQPVAGLKILLSTDDEWVKTIDAQQALGVLPAADTVAVAYDAQDAETFSSFEVLPGAPEDHIIHFEVTLYDTSFNLWQNEVAMRIDAFAAEPEMQLIEHIEGPARGTFGIYIVDPAALTGDSYRITINDETGEIEDRTLNLFNISTGDTVLQNHPLPDEFGHNMPVMDGFKLTRGTLDFHGGIDQFLEVRFNGQPVEPPQPVWQQANSNGSYALSEPPPSGLRSNVSALKDHDVEIRFTNDGGFGWYSFESGNAVGVPFELWDTGTATPDDSTDDVRLIPILFSNGGSLDVFDIDSLSLDSFYGLPSSDRIYFYDGDYEAFEDMAKGGNVRTLPGSSISAGY
ncbi:MAG: hypothetical protein O7G31_08180 [Calditrichaeota bacterium]|nr:hypothetical protein [Calditrichota bacterium]